MNRHTSSLFGVRHSTILLLVLVPVSFSGCASTEKVKFSRHSPGLVKAKGIQSLAVSDFDGPGDYGRRVADLFSSKLSNGTTYRLVERDKLNVAIKEQGLGMSGMVDEQTAAKTGKVLGVEAIITGKATYSVTDEPYAKSVMVTRATGTYRTECDKKGTCYNVPNFQQVPTEERHHKRNGTVSVSYRVIRVETGEALGGYAATENYKYDTGNTSSSWSSKETAAELGAEEVLSTLTEKVVATLVEKLLPHQVYLDVELETGGKHTRHGIELIRAERLEDAIQYYETLVRNDPQNSSAYYNLGCAYALVGNAEKAESAWRAAEGIDPKPRYIAAVGSAVKRREELKAREQQKK